MKSTTIVFTVLLISGAQAFLVNKTLLSLQANMDSALAGHQKAVLTLVGESQEILLGLEEDAAEILKMVSDSVSVKSKKIAQKISNITSAAGGKNVNDCAAIGKQVAPLAQQTIAKMRSCVNKEIESANQSVQNITYNLNWIADHLSKSRKDALKNCSAKVDGYRDVAEAVVCINEMTSNLTMETIRGVANVRNPISQLQNLPLSFFEPALSCVGRDGYKSFKKESLRIIDEVQNCVDSKIGEPKLSTASDPQQAKLSVNPASNPQQAKLSPALNPQQLKNSQIPTLQQRESSPTLTQQQPEPSAASDPQQTELPTPSESQQSEIP